MASDSTERNHSRGQVTPIAWMYVVYGLGLCLACLAEAPIAPLPLSPTDAFVPLLIIVAGVGAILRKPWGRWLCYVFSAFLLLGVPLGTIIGGRMIHQLTVHRDQFRPSARTVSHGS